MSAKKEVVDTEVLAALIVGLLVVATENALWATIIWATFALFFPALGITWLMALIPAGVVFVFNALAGLVKG